MKTQYEILGISETATAAEIKKAFKQLALQYHPDKNPSQAAEQQFKTINEAYQILSNPTKRYYYDQTFRTRTFEEEVPPPKTDSSKSYAYKPPISDWKIGGIFFAVFLLLLAALPLFSYLEIERDFEIVADAIRNNDYNRAIKYLNHANDKGGDASRIYYYEARLRLEKNKDYRAAIFYINKALSFDSENPDYLMLLAKIYIELPTYIYDVPSILAPVLTQDHEHPEANFYLGQYHLYKQNYSEALQCFEYALADPDLQFKTQIYYAIVLQKQAHHREAITIFESLENNTHGRAEPIDLVNLFYHIGQHHFIEKDTLKACNYWRTARNIIYVENVDTQIKAFCVE